MYKIKIRQRENAKRIGVVIRPSATKGKKIDVYKNGFFVASIGDIKYRDYATYLMEEYKGIVTPGEANKRRESYLIRHTQDRMVKGSPGWYAWQILWE
jgi:hypothetical protein